MFNSKTSVTKAARWLNGDDRRGVDIAPIAAPAQAGAAVGLRGDAGGGLPAALVCAGATASFGPLTAGSHFRHPGEGRDLAGA